MNPTELVGLLLIIAAIPFFWGGSLGMLRFPDVYTRLHALTKADNLGLGLVTTGSMFLADDWMVAIKLLFIWLLVLTASTVSCFLIANAARKTNKKPWKAS
jgi:multicomponent Na+:H+ antiporter subunit G